MVRECPNCGLPAIEHGIYCQSCYRLVDMDEVTEVIPKLLFLSGEMTIPPFAGERFDVRPWVLFPESGRGQTSLLTMLSLCHLIDAKIQAKVPFCLHCTAGAERSPLVVACYLVLSKRYPTLFKAYRFLQSKRPVVLDRSDFLSQDTIAVIERKISQERSWSYGDFVKVV